MNQKPVDALSEVEVFLKLRASKNKRRKSVKNQQPVMYFYTSGHIFEGAVLRITSELVEIRERKWCRDVFPNYVNEEYRYTGLRLIILRKDIIAVGVNEEKLGEP